MKFAIVTDLHVGVRNDSPLFLDAFRRFCENVFIPAIDANGIKTVVFMGDLFDKRRTVNVQSLEYCKKYFLTPLIERKIAVDLIIGNHDTYFKNTNALNSPSVLIEGGYEGVSIYTSPAEVERHGKKFLYVPWITDENRETSLEMITRSNASMVFGHLEIDGFDYIRGVKCSNGLSQTLFKRFDWVFSGHFHNRQVIDRFHYVGTPYEMTFNDVDEDKGFYVFDLDAGDFEFVVNPDKIFYQLDLSSLDDVKAAKKLVKNTELKDKIIRINCSDALSPDEVEHIVDEIQKHDPSNVTIRQSYTVSPVAVDNTELYMSNSSLDSLMLYVDEMKISESEGKSLKEYIVGIYNEAISRD